jgi:uncharacterized protein
VKLYSMAPFLWAQWGNETLLTNDAGRHIFIPQDEFHLFVENKLAKDTQVYKQLVENGFTYSGPKEIYLDRWSQEVRHYKGCLFSATQLFILVLTDACNQRCVYCQASAGRTRLGMTAETAIKTIDLAFSSPADTIMVEFQGGEPMLNPSALKAAVLHAEERRKATGKNLSMAIVTNLTNDGEDLIGWLLDRDVGISTSLDGPPCVHDRNRPMADWTGSYDKFQRGIQSYQMACTRRGKNPEIQAIQTTTRYSLPYAREIIDEYQKLGVKAVYLRPLTPLGAAANHWDIIGYTPSEYLTFYRGALAYMLELAKSGIQIREVTASTYLRRILLHEAVYHTEFRSPCGGGVGQMAIQYNGDVYTCDEGRMLATCGDTAFRLGTVDESYRKLIASPVVYALCTASCIEGLPGCCDCVFQPFCSTCPVVTYGIRKDLFEHGEGSYHCEIAKGILGLLFSLIHDADEVTMGILCQWAQ